MRVSKFKTFECFQPFGFHMLMTLWTTAAAGSDATNSQIHWKHSNGKKCPWDNLKWFMKQQHQLPFNLRVCQHLTYPLALQSKLHQNKLPMQKIPAIWFWRLHMQGSLRLPTPQQLHHMIHMNDQHDFHQIQISHHCNTPLFALTLRLWDWHQFNEKGKRTSESTLHRLF